MRGVPENPEGLQLIKKLLNLLCGNKEEDGWMIDVTEKYRFPSNPEVAPRSLLVPLMEKDYVLVTNSWLKKEEFFRDKELFTEGEFEVAKRIEILKCFVPGKKKGHETFKERLKILRGE